MISSGGRPEAATRLASANGTSASVPPSSSLGYFGPEDNPPFWYSFDYGIVHFTIVSSEHDLAPGSLQYEWLQVWMGFVWTLGDDNIALIAGLLQSSAGRGG